MEKNPGDHPKLSSEDAVHVTDYLMTLTSNAVKAGSVKIKKRNIKGKQIFTKKMPCSGCHQYRLKKKVTGGVTGPSLLNAHERLNPDWMYAYMASPKVFKPVKMMPVFSGLLKKKDMQQVVAFVANKFK